MERGGESDLSHEKGKAGGGGCLESSKARLHWKPHSFELYTSPKRKYYFPHFTDEKTKTEKGRNTQNRTSVRVGSPCSSYCPRCSCRL